MDKTIVKSPFVPLKRTLVAISFTNGKRKLYFIDNVRDGDISRQTMLLGQFLHDFMESPKEALALTPGCTDRIYFPSNSGVCYYEKPTAEDFNEFIEQMKKLIIIHADMTEEIGYILEDVEKQRNAPETWQDPQIKLPPDHSVIKVTLTERGSKSFEYIKNAQEGHQELYYIESLIPGPVYGTTSLIGQFLPEFEGCPSEALLLKPCTANKLYFPEDRNVVKYETPNDEELGDFIHRMRLLAENNSEFEEAIYSLMGSLKHPVAN